MCTTAVLLQVLSKWVWTIQRGPTLTRLEPLKRSCRHPELSHAAAAVATAAVTSN